VAKQFGSDTVVVYTKENISSKVTAKAYAVNKQLEQELFLEDGEGDTTEQAERNAAYKAINAFHWQPCMDEGFVIVPD